MSYERTDSPTRDDLRRRTMRGVRPLGRGTLALVIVIPLILGTVIGGFGGGLLRTASPSSTPAATSVTFHLESHSYYFLGVGGTINGLKNPTLNVQVGDQVTIVLTDGETMTHNLYVDGYNVQSADVSTTGASATISFTASQQGTFAYYCAIPGHREMGMEGQLVVGSGEGNGTASLPPIGPEVTPFANIVHNATDIPPVITRTTPTTVNIYLEAKEVNAEIEPGTSYTYWTYNGTVPGPFFRVLLNDTVIVHFSNAASSTMNHSVDFHAVTGPGGGAAYLQTAPGHESNISFKALVPGLFVYHCGTPNVPTHIAQGMFGMILVQPSTPLPPVDREFYVMQSELYTKWPIHTPGNQLFDGAKLESEDPTYVVFNGAYQALTGNQSLTGNVNETIRIYFGDIGPNMISSFHIIGEIFERAWLFGDLTDAPFHGLQTVLVPAGGAVVVDLHLEYPGRYILVDHAIVRAMDLGALGFLDVSGWANSTVFNPSP